MTSPAPDPRFVYEGDRARRIAFPLGGIGAGGMSLSSAWLFLIGLPLGAAIVAAVRGGASLDTVALPALLVAGLLVGFGTRIGSGCTSGHGVCGVSRLAPRSLLATATFMAAGMLTVFVLRVAGIHL